MSPTCRDADTVLIKPLASKPLKYKNTMVPVKIAKREFAVRAAVMARQELVATLHVLGQKSSR